jgi:hypothetical protein
MLPVETLARREGLLFLAHELSSKADELSFSAIKLSSGAHEAGWVPRFRGWFPGGGARAATFPRRTAQVQNAIPCAPMRAFIALLALAILPRVAPTDWRSAPPADWQAIFNGRNLDGWTVNGYIGLQAESQPVEFRNIRLLNLAGCMDPNSPAYRTYFARRDDARCTRR